MARISKKKIIGLFSALVISLSSVASIAAYSYSTSIWCGAGHTQTGQDRTYSLNSIKLYFKNVSVPSGSGQTSSNFKITINKRNFLIFPEITKTFNQTFNDGGTYTLYAYQEGSGSRERFMEFKSNDYALSCNDLTLSDY